MEEKHRYKSVLMLGVCKHDLPKTQEALLAYLKDNTLEVTHYHTERNDLYEYHQKGISIHVQSTKRDKPFSEEETPKKELMYLDITLISDMTSTKDLEDKLNTLADKFKL